MQRYFSNQKEGNNYLLSRDDNYHIKKVMRMVLHDKIEIVDNHETYICEIIDLNPVKAKVVEKLGENNELSKKVIVIQSLVNENKMDFILQKCTELGMYAFYGYTATNSIVKMNEKKEKKQERWQRIVKEASEQSKRNIIQEVVDILNLDNLCKIQADLKLLLTVNEKVTNIKNVIHKNENCDTIIIVVGPEGGFTHLEEEKLIKSGFIATSIAKSVLRTETAGVATLAMLNYEWMV